MTAKIMDFIQKSIFDLMFGFGKKMKHSKKEEKNSGDMNFLQHLEVLRWHLVRSAVAIVVVAIAAFIFKGFVFDTVIFGPKKADFITYQWLCSLSEWLSLQFPEMLTKDAICIGQNIPNLQNITMAGQFTTHILISIVAGIVIAFPYVFWEIWRFISPGLQVTERKTTRGVVALTSILFLSGVLFGYYIISPLSINFFINYSVSDDVINIPTLNTYITTVTTIVLASGFIFELPILVYFLTKFGILTPAFLRKYRRHSIVGALILSAIITPPDIFSQLLVSVPLLFLYEISIFISGRVLKKTEHV